MDVNRLQKGEASAPPHAGAESLGHLAPGLPVPSRPAHRRRRRNARLKRRARATLAMRALKAAGRARLAAPGRARASEKEDLACQG